MMGAAGFFSGRSQGCCTLDRRTPVDRFRIFPAIPRFFLERRFPVDMLLAAELILGVIIRVNGLNGLLGSLYGITAVTIVATVAWVAGRYRL